MRKGAHRIKPMKRTWTPTVAIFGCSGVTSSAPYSTGTPKPATSQGLILCTARFTSGRYVTDTPSRCSSIDELIELIDHMGNRNRTVYVVMDSVIDTFTEFKLWDIFKSGLACLDGWNGKEYITLPNGRKRKRRPTPFIMSRQVELMGIVTASGTKAKFISYRNHINISINDMYAHYSRYQNEFIGEYNRNTFNIITNHDSCICMRSAYIELWNEWRSRKCGGWSDTISGLGMSWYRSSEGFYPILRHNWEDVQAMESASAFGGTSRVWFFGDIIHKDMDISHQYNHPRPSRYDSIISKCHRIDIRSMYAHILSTCKFPVEYIGRVQSLSLKSLRIACNNVCIIARCALKPRDNIYPYRIDGDIWYPYGEFITTLTTPELIQSINRKEVVKVHDAIMYKAAPCFERIGSDMIDRRMKYKHDGNVIMQHVIKGIANSFTGRLAMNKRKLVARPAKPSIQDWGLWHEIDQASGESREFRAIAGHTFELSISEAKPGGTTAIYSHITAYGRVLMNQFREIIGRDNCIAQDVDGLWITDDGLQRALQAGIIRDAVPGFFQLESSSEWSRFITPKHHYHATNWTLSGISNPRGVIHDGQVVNEVAINPVRSGNDPNDGGIRIVRSKVRIESIPTGSCVNPLGWEDPVRIDGGIVLWPLREHLHEEEE